MQIRPPDASRKSIRTSRRAGRQKVPAARERLKPHQTLHPTTMAAISLRDELRLLRAAGCIPPRQVLMVSQLDLLLARVEIGVAPGRQVVENLLRVAAGEHQ